MLAETRTDLPGEQKAVLARKHEIQENEVDPLSLQACPHGGPVLSLFDRETLLAQIPREHLADPGIIVDNEDVRLVGQSSTPGTLLGSFSTGSRVDVKAPQSSTVPA